MGQSSSESGNAQKEFTCAAATEATAALARVVSRQHAEIAQT
jgi:hypothetical protein